MVACVIACSGVVIVSTAVFGWREREREHDAYWNAMGDWEDPALSVEGFGYLGNS